MEIEAGIHDGCKKHRLAYTIVDNLENHLTRRAVELVVRDKWESGRNELGGVAVITNELYTFGTEADGQTLVEMIALSISERKQGIRFARLADR